MTLNRAHVVVIFAFVAILVGAALYLRAPSLLGLTAGDAAEALDGEIIATPPGSAEAPRRALLLEFDDLIAGNIPTTVRPQTQATSLLELRTRRAVEEIRDAAVPEGSMRVWYIYNMGVVLKTSKATVGIDVAGTYEAPSIADVGSLLDVLVVTHPHGDHLDSKVASAAAKAGAKIVVADEMVRLDSNPTQIVRDPEGTSMVKLLTGSTLAAEALVGVEPGVPTDVGGIRLTAIPAEHSSPDSTWSKSPVDWFYVEVSGFGVLHTGDGYFPDSKPDLTDKQVDLYIVHYVDEIYAEDYQRLAPQSRVMLPLHLHELGHGAEILDYGMFKNALDQEKGGHLWLEHADPRDTGIMYEPMIWGESITLSLTP